MLGTLQVARDGSPVALPSRRQRAVLAALLIAAGAPTAPDVLVEAAWGTRLPEHPRAALHTVVSRLRAALGAELLRADVPGYRLAVGVDDVDAQRFEALRDRAAHAADDAAAELLDEALALWRGPAYAEFADRDFAAAEAARLNELRAAAVEDFAQHSLRSPRVVDAITRLQALLGDEPWRARAVELLMRALAATGRATEALDVYDRHRRGLAAELGLDPPPELRELHLRMLRREPLPKPPARRGPDRRPAETDPLVGRDGELATLLDAVHRHRQVTVTGVGGVGKTRLVVGALDRLARSGTPSTLAELGTTAPGDVDGAVALALGLERRDGTARDAVLDYLTAETRLLVLDNCEQVLADVRDLVRAVLPGCPGVRVLATSRRRLGTPREQVLPLAPLAIPPADAPEGDLRGSAAVRLFLDRMRRVRPGAAETAETVALGAEVCRRVDGVPLAIELAAAQVAAVGLSGVVGRLDDLAVLAGADGGLRAVLDQSWSLLTGREQQLLARLSVFAAGFDIEAVEQLDGPDAARPLARLAESSLLDMRHDHGRVRYRLLAMVRAFAAERLRAAGATAAAEAAHARWIRDLAEAAAADIRAGGEAEPLRRLLEHRADLVAVLRRALGSGEIELAGTIIAALGWCTHWVLDREVLTLARQVAHDGRLDGTPVSSLARSSGALHAAQLGELDDACDLGGTALRLASTPQEQAMALHALGVVSVYRGAHQESAQHWRRLLDLPEVPAPLQVDAHASLALLGCFGSDPAAAPGHAERALAAARRAGPVGAFATYAMAEVRLLEDPAAAVELLDTAVAQAEAARTAQIAEVARIALVSALVRLGRHDQAGRVFPDLLEQLRRRGGWPQLWTCLRILAELLAACHRPRDAAFLLAAARPDPAAPPPTGDDVARYRDLEARLLADLGAAEQRRVADQAVVSTRAEVLTRAVAALADLGGELRPPRPPSAARPP